MTQISAYRVRIDTQSADENGVLLFLRERLVACLSQLDDECHGELRGSWCIEMAFGFPTTGLPDHFPALGAAVAAISQRVTGSPIELAEALPELL